MLAPNTHRAPVSKDNNTFHGSLCLPNVASTFGPALVGLLGEPGRTPEVDASRHFRARRDYAF